MWKIAIVGTGSGKSVKDGGKCGLLIMSQSLALQKNFFFNVCLRHLQNIKIYLTK